MKKSITILCGSAFLFGLNACSDSDSSSTSAPATETVVSSADKLPRCKSGVYDSVYVVKPEGDKTNGVKYICYEPSKEWIAMIDELPNCGPSKEDVKLYENKTQEAYVCRDEWESLGGDDDEFDDDKFDQKSSSSKGSVFDDEDFDQPAAKKQVTFVDGIIWQPSYGTRARTGLVSKMTEYNFNDVKPLDNGSWSKYLDDKDGGTSTAIGHFTDEYLELDVDLAYENFKTEYTTYWNEYDGEYQKTRYIAADPYPYAGFSLSVLMDGEPSSVYDIDETGICVTYTAVKKFRVSVASSNIDDSGFYSYLLPDASSPTTVNVKWKDFEKPEWATNTITRSTAFDHATNFDFKYTNDETNWSCSSSSPSSCPSRHYTNKIKIYKIGTYGSCNGSSIGDSYL